jgi:hypothetical protein
MEYTVIGCPFHELEERLKGLAEDGWDLVTMAGSGTSFLAVILERPDEHRCAS